MSLRPDEVSDDPLHAANEIIRLESERDSLRSQLEEARAQLGVAASRDRDWVAMCSDLKAALDRIGALVKLVDRCAEGFDSVRRSSLQRAHHAADEMLVIIRAAPLGLTPAEAEDLNFIGSAALAPAPAAVPTREVLTPEQAEEMRKEGAALSEEIKRRTAPMKRGPFEPRVDPFDSGKGEP